MNKRIISCLVVSLLVFSLANPGQAITLVPDCAQSGNCTTCDFLAVLINFTQIVGVAAGTSAVLMLIIGGVVWIVAGANEALVEKGKKIVVGTMTGLVIVFFAWIIVNFTIYALAGGSLGDVRIFSQEWWNPECKTSNLTVKCDGDDDQVGDKCQDEAHYCYGQSGTALETNCVLAGGCTCGTVCDLKASTDGLTKSCVANGSNCSSGYTAYLGDDSCGEGQRCCLKY